MSKKWTFCRGIFVKYKIRNTHKELYVLQSMILKKNYSFHTRM